MNKIYETDSYLRKINTIVNTCQTDGEEILLTLRDTILFPKEGGQNADTGSLICTDGRCTKVYGGELKDNEIYYKVSEYIAPGTHVEVLLDWESRYMRMQQHSAEHILSGIIHSEFGYDNVGFHLSDQEAVTVDLNGILSDADLKSIEMKVNKVICENLPITDSYPTEEELKNIDYRSKIDISGQVRLITIGNESKTVDICACCAPHLKNTGEAGLLKIINSINYKGGTRLFILCGFRAFEYLSHEHDMLKNLALSFSSSIEDVPVKIHSLKAELTQSHEKLRNIMEYDLTSQINNMNSSDIPCVFLDESSSDMMKLAYNTLAGRFPDKYVGVFLGNDRDGYRYNIGNPLLDSLKLSDDIKTSLTARGGGNNQMLQGMARSSQDSIARFFINLNS